MTYTAPARREPGVASYVECKGPKRWLHIRGPKREAVQLAAIALDGNPGSRIIERIDYPTTGNVDIIIELLEAS